jgi:hypothetical protein
VISVDVREQNRIRRIEVNTKSGRLSKGTVTGVKKQRLTHAFNYYSRKPAISRWCCRRSSKKSHFDFSQTKPYLEFGETRRSMPGRT